MAAALCFAASVCVGVYLVATGGWPVVAIGLLSILAGWAYTGGPVPSGYLGLGEVFVLLFFTSVRHRGTEWVQALWLPGSTWLAALSVGSTATTEIRQQPARHRHRPSCRQAHAGGAVRPAFCPGRIRLCAGGCLPLAGGGLGAGPGRDAPVLGPWPRFRWPGPRCGW